MSDSLNEIMLFLFFFFVLRNIVSLVDSGFSDIFRISSHEAPSLRFLSVLSMSHHHSLQGCSLFAFLLLILIKVKFAS